MSPLHDVESHPQSSSAVDLPPPKAEHEHVEERVHKALVASHAFIEEEVDGMIYIKSVASDPDSPRSWPNWKRYGIVILASWLNNLVTICVSGYSTGSGQLEEEFGVSGEIGTLGLSLFILGFASGPMLLAPMSEFFGRRPVYLVSWALFVIFQIPLAVAPNIATVLVCRFFQGFFGSTPLANTGGVVHDLFGRDEGGYAVAIYALSSTDGPSFGNAVSGFIAQQKGWRWLFWVYLIIFGAHWFIIYFFMPETRDTIVMMKKAARLREETGNPSIFAAHERERGAPGHLWKVSLLRPFRFLFTEPITYLCALINGLTYGIIFLANEAFPLVFGAGNGGHGWTHIGTINLTYLSFVLGAFIGFSLQPLQERFYHKKVAEADGKSNPEARWGSSRWATPFLAVGLFIAAWTSYPHITFIAPLVGFTLFGIAFYIIITAILNYVVDSYGHFSASSLAGVVMVRNIFGAAFPLFAKQMFVNLGNQWALCLLAFLCLLCIPIPFLLYHKGKAVRRASPYCAAHIDETD